MADYTVEPYIRETLKYYHGAEPAGTTQMEFWTPHFRKYHRDNLISLFNAIGYGEPPIKPFHIFNTGDWNGEIPQMLAKPVIIEDYKKPNPNPAGRLAISYTIDENDRPNQTREYMVNSVLQWLTIRIHTVETGKVPNWKDCVESDGHRAKAKLILEQE